MTKATTFPRTRFERRLARQLIARHRGEATAIARSTIKAVMRAKGVKVSWVSASEISKCAAEMLTVVMGRA